MNIYNPRSQVFGFYYVDKILINYQPHDGLEEQAEKLAMITLVQDLKTRMTMLRSRFFSEDGLHVDYSSMSESEEFSAIHGLSCKLVHATLDELSDWSKLAVFINIYNFLTLHSLCWLYSESITDKNKIRDIDSSMWSRWKFFAQFSYVIGGMAFSLNDIENGILRANSPSPIPFSTCPFNDPEDPRRAFVIPLRDPRIHFALNCGAMSCPPIQVYNMLDLAAFQAQLALATSIYLENHLSVETSQASGISSINPFNLWRQSRDKIIVCISPLLKWFRQDFVFDMIRKKHEDQLTQHPGNTASIEAIMQHANSNSTFSDRLIVEWVLLNLPADTDSLANLAKMLRRSLDEGIDLELKYEDYDWRLNH